MNEQQLSKDHPEWKWTCIQASTTGIFEGVSGLDKVHVYAIPKDGGVEWWVDTRTASVRYEAWRKGGAS